jgi:hypothetical protein
MIARALVTIALCCVAPARGAAGPDPETIVRFDAAKLAAAIRGATLPEGLSEFDCSRLRLESSTVREAGVHLVFVDPDRPRHQASLLLREGRLTGVIDHADGLQERFTSCGAGRAVRELADASDALPCGGPLEQDPPMPRHGEPPIASMTSGCDTGAVIDVAAFYTTAAMQDAGSRDGVLDWIEWSIARSNQIYLNSGVPVTLRLVSSLETPGYVEDASNMGNDLSALTNETDGAMDEVHDIRDTVGADLVMLIRENGGGYCGIAWILWDNSASASNAGFSVTALGCIPYSVVTHEIGHNMGCCHTPGDGGGCGDHGLFNYSAGHRFTGDDGVLYCTVMSYSPGQGIPHFSSPLVTYQGVATGVDGSRDNARTIIETSAALANFRCAVEPIGDGGIVRCWGADDRGQSAVPSTLRGVDHVAAGQLHSVASRSDGSVVCWGSNDYGQCSPPSTLPPIAEVDAGVRHSMGRGTDGLVHCWGANEYGQSSVPADLGTVSSIASGGFHCLALRTNGTVRGWGQNNFAQCNVPAAVTTALAIGAGASHSLAIKADGLVAGWGRNTNGQATIPATLGPCNAIAGGDLHSVAIRADGSVRCWGYNNYGQCTVPSDVASAIEVAAGSSHTAALLADGSVRAWGRNNLGQTGVPAALAGVSGIDSGANHLIVRVLVADCNSNGIADAIDIASGANDSDGDGRIDACETAKGDIDLDGNIDFGDVALILLDFGPCPDCATDLDATDQVDFGDVALALLNFGPAG